MSTADFTVIIDTREQLPYAFDGFDVETINRALPEGDYAIDGLDGCVIERKSVTDLLGCMTNGRDRFQAELDRLRSYEFSAVVVEQPEYLLYASLTRMNPKSAKATLVAWQSRFPTKWIFCQDRRWAEKTTFLLLERFWRDVRDGKRLVRPKNAGEKRCDRDLKGHQPERLAAAAVKTRWQPCYVEGDH